MKLHKEIRSSTYLHRRILRQRETRISERHVSGESTDEASYEHPKIPSTDSGFFASSRPWPSRVGLDPTLAKSHRGLAALRPSDQVWSGFDNRWTGSGQHVCRVWTGPGKSNTCVASASSSTLFLQVANFGPWWSNVAGTRYGWCDFGGFLQYAVLYLGPVVAADRLDPETMMHETR